MKATSQTETVETKTTTLTVNRDQVAACALAMAKGDVRYYLNGCKFECLDGGKVAAIATDGHRIHAGIVGTWEGDKQDFILANEYTGMLTKNPSDKRFRLQNAEVKAVTTITTRPNPDYSHELAESGVTVGNSGLKEFVTSETKITFPFKEMQVTVKPIEGKYPEWRLVCMNRQWSEEGHKQWTSADIVNQHVFLQPSYQLDAAKAFALYLVGVRTIRKGEEARYMSDVATFGENKPVVFTKDGCEFFALVMPARAGLVALNMPEWVFGGAA